MALCRFLIHLYQFTYRSELVLPSLIDAQYL